ncbi:MAG: hypothetical protein ABI537_01460 [Casimicrobiaceae bacterium]
MQLTLVVSGLLDIAPSLLAPTDTVAPAFERLLAAAEAPLADPDGCSAIVCAALGVAKQRDWPVAPLLARASEQSASAQYWLCADPATLEAGRDDVRLRGIVWDLKIAETAALLATLNTHFADDGLQFVAPTPNCWLVACAGVQAIATRPPDTALGKPLFAYLPSGADAANWQRWQSEMQMLLFEHPVNAAREAAGQAVVNGVWLWGGGEPVKAPAHPRIAALFADDWRTRGLAHGAGISDAALPGSLDALRSQSTLSPALARLSAPIVGDDSTSQLGHWLTTLEQQWIKPAAGAFHVGTVSELDVVLTGRAKTLRFRARRLTLARRLRIWRAAPRLSTLLTPHFEP